MKLLGKAAACLAILWMIFGLAGFALWMGDLQGAVVLLKIKLGLIAAMLTVVFCGVALLGWIERRFGDSNRSKVEWALIAVGATLALTYDDNLRWLLGL